MFEYAYLYPALGIIVGGILIMTGILTETEIISSLSYIILMIATLWGISWGIYRGVKTSFSITHSLFEDNFEKTSFKESIAITENKWGRIIGNFILVGLIGGLLTGLVSGLLSSISFLTTDFESFLQIENNSQNLENILGNIGNFNAVTFITDAIGNILGSILGAFMIVFIVVFYLRLKAEHNNPSSPQTQTPKIKKDTKYREL